MKHSAPISFIQIIISKEYICTSHMALYAKMYTIFVVRYLLTNYTNICIYIHSIYLPWMPSTSIIESPSHTWITRSNRPYLMPSSSFISTIMPTTTIRTIKHLTCKHQHTNTPKMNILTSRVKSMLSFFT